MKNIAILLSAAAILWSCGCKKCLVVSLENPINIERNGETVEIVWGEILKSINGATSSNIIVFNGDGTEIVSQVIFRDGNPASIIFQADLDANGKAQYTIKEGKPSGYTARAFGRFVPERKDDFAWENDKVVHRMYGPILEATGEISNGIDVWIKNTDSLVIDSWYRRDDYHRDHGEGLDCYKVGRTLGAGAMAPYVDGKLWLGNNFTSYEILDNGPLRVTFALDYAPFQVGESTITEKRIITLDAGSHFNKITEIYGGSSGSMSVAAGIVLRGDQGEKSTGMDWACYWEPRNNDNNTDNGHTGVCVIIPGASGTAETEGHLLVTSACEFGKPLVYYMGTAWSKAGVSSSEEWIGICCDENLKITNPIVVKY